MTKRPWAVVVVAALWAVVGVGGAPPGLQKANPCDVDKNGFVNGDDADVFRRWFEAGDLRADFDGNGFVTGEDFDAFTAAFQRGGFVATTYTINSASVFEHGCILELVCTGATPTDFDSFNPYTGLLAGNSRALSSGQKMMYVGSRPTYSGGTTTLKVHFLIDPADRVPYTGATSGITFSCDDGFLVDGFGNKLGAVSGLTVTNYSMKNADGTPYTQLFDAPTGGPVRVYVNWKDGSDTGTIAGGRGTLAQPFKTKRYAETALLAAHQNDGSHIAVVTDGTSLYTEVVDTTTKHCRMNLAGPSRWRRAMVYPVNTSGVFTNEYRNITSITPSSSEDRLAFSRDSYSDAEGVSATADNVYIYGQRVESSDKSTTCRGFGFKWIGKTWGVFFDECQVDGVENGFLAQDESDTEVMGDVVFNRCGMFDIWSTVAHAVVGILTEGIGGREELFECHGVNVGFRDAAFTSGDALSRFYYSSDDYGGSAASGMYGVMTINNPADWAQQRKGGRRTACLDWLSAMAGFGGGRLGFTGMYNTSGSLRDMVNAGDDSDERPYGLSVNGSNKATAAPSWLHQNILTDPKAGGILKYNARAFGANGQLTGASVTIDHNVSKNVGPLTSLHAVGVHPKRLTVTDNVFTKTTGNIDVAFALVSMQVVEADTSYFVGDRNCFEMNASHTADFGYVDSTGLTYSVAGFTTLFPTFMVGVDLTAPTFADTSRTPLSWLEHAGGVSGVTAAGNLMRNRALNSWPAWADARAAWEWISTGWVASNKVRSSGLLDRKGVTPGFMEMDYESGDAPPPAGNRRSRLRQRVKTRAA